MRRLSFLSSSTSHATTCRYCGSTDVRPSRKAQVGSRQVLYRCRACKSHFKVAHTSFRELLPVISFVVFVLMFVFLAASIYESTLQAGGFSDTATDFHKIKLL